MSYNLSSKNNQFISIYKCACMYADYICMLGFSVTYCCLVLRMYGKVYIVTIPIEDVA